MKDTLRNILVGLVADLDSGNSNLNEEDTSKLVDTLKLYTDKTRRVSKYEACQFLGILRATFDNLVRDGQLPRGEHQIGFKELSWSLKDLENYKNIVK